jgi:glucose/arabinose dehydrogenase
MASRVSLLLFLLSFVGLPLADAAAESPLLLAPAFPNLVFDDAATALAITPEKPQRMVVAFQKGLVRVLPQDRNAAEAASFLDLREKIQGQFSFEDGLHGLAFHPSFARERHVYVCYSRLEPRRTVLSEFTVLAKGAFQADPASERILLEFLHPMGNHWGGGIAFGPDGFLYLGIGDGGVRDDPYRLGQNLWTLHGKILRIDVNKRDPGLAYAIPADNPFADKQEMRHEIWASGIRNPWGMAFDRATGTLWCADVGQDTWEEVNLIKKGGNYGWSEREGPARFAVRERQTEEGGPFIDPIHFYAHSEGISITGGYVYRGKRLRGFQGTYLFGDWGSGKIWSLSWDPKTESKTDVRQLYASTPDTPRFNPTVIAPDVAGEPLLFSQNPSMIYTLREPALLADADAPDESPADGVPAPEDATEPPGDPVPNDGAS